MSTKSGGSSGAHQGANQRGKCRGLKAGDGQNVKSGAIIIRQRGTQFHPGSGVGLGRDYTIFATTEGVVKFSTKLGKKVVSVL